MFWISFIIFQNHRFYRSLFRFYFFNCTNNHFLNIQTENNVLNISSFIYNLWKLGNILQMSCINIGRQTWIELLVGYDQNCLIAEHGVNWVHPEKKVAGSKKSVSVWVCHHTYPCYCTCLLAYAWKGQNQYDYLGNIPRLPSPNYVTYINFYYAHSVNYCGFYVSTTVKSASRFQAMWSQ
jgi:hypothetical protein